MKKIILAIWLCLPVAAWAYHQGPGQEEKKLDQVDSTLLEAVKLMQAGDHDGALKEYENALKQLPSDRVAEARKIRVELNKLRMLHRQLPDAQEDLAQLVEEMAKDEDADPEVLMEARHAYANSQYYIAYLMRLEGYTREEWEPELEISRQVFRLLAEDAVAGGKNEVALERKEDLESTVRLARLELQDLQGLPLPNQ